MLQEILKAREERWLRRCQLVEHYQSPVISITLNIPGPEKTKKLYQEAHKKISQDFCQYLKDQGHVSLVEEYRFTADGPEAYLILVGKHSAWELKKVAIEFENNHPLGRLVDIDIMDEEKNIISRNNLGKLERKCLLCAAPARECIINRKHSLEELLMVIENMILQQEEFKEE